MLVHRRRVISIVVFVLIAWLAIAGLLAALGYSKARAGRNDLEAARAAATSEGLSSGQVETKLLDAANNLNEAHSRLSNPIIQPLRLIPLVGRQISSGIALTKAGADISQAAADALDQTASLNSQAKTNRQTTLSQLSEIASGTDGKLAKVKLGPNEGLWSPLARARNEISEDLISTRAGLQRAAAGARGAAALFNTSSHYLVFAANNAEMRSGSGMFLQAGTMTTGGGNLDVGTMAPVGNYNLANDQVTWPPELEANWGWLQDKGNYQDLMLSPRFDVSAPIAVDMWKKSTGADVDGVLVVDPVMLEAILTATGPIDVNGKQVTKDNVVQTLLFDQYKGLDVNTTNDQRREALSDVASIAFATLSKGTWDPIVLAKELATAANGRHVLVWSKDTALNRQWQIAGVAGELDANSLMLSIVNLGGNKLDQFLKVNATANQEVTEDGYDMTITTKITNNAPVDGPQYVVGPFPGSTLSKGQYSGLLNFNLPGDATGVQFDGDQQGFVQGPDGPTQAIAIAAQLNRGETKTFVLHFYRSKQALFTRVMPSARVPASQWQFRNEQWNDGNSHFIIP